MQLEEIKIGQDYHLRGRTDWVVTVSDILSPEKEQGQGAILVAWKLPEDRKGMTIARFLAPWELTPVGG